MASPRRTHRRTASRGEGTSQDSVAESIRGEPEEGTTRHQPELQSLTAMVQPSRTDGHLRPPHHPYTSTSPRPPSPASPGHSYGHASPRHSNNMSQHNSLNNPSLHYTPQPTKSGRVPNPPPQEDINFMLAMDDYFEFPSESESDDEDFVPPASSVPAEQDEDGQEGDDSNEHDAPGNGSKRVTRARTGKGRGREDEEELDDGFTSEAFTIDEGEYEWLMSNLNGNGTDADVENDEVSSPVKSPDVALPPPLYRQTWLDTGAAAASTPDMDSPAVQPSSSLRSSDIVRPRRENGQAHSAFNAPSLPEPARNQPLPNNSPHNACSNVQPPSSNSPQCSSAPVTAPLATSAAPVQQSLPKAPATKPPKLKRNALPPPVPGQVKDGSTTRSGRTLRETASPAPSVTASKSTDEVNGAAAEGQAKQQKRRALSPAAALAAKRERNKEDSRIHRARKKQRINENATEIQQLRLHNDTLMDQVKMMQATIDEHKKREERLVERLTETKAQLAAERVRAQYDKANTGANAIETGIPAGARSGTINMEDLGTFMAAMMKAGQTQAAAPSPSTMDHHSNPIHPLLMLAEAGRDREREGQE